MSEFAAALAARQPPNIDKRRWLIVPYDQLSDQIGPLARENPKELGLVVVENPWKAARRPYHQQKLALVLANLRHFSLEQASRGVAIRHVVAAGPYQTAIEPLLAELGPLRMMEPAERELRVDLEPLVDAGSVELIPHEGWLTSDDDLTAGRKGGPPWRMDRFYRQVRRRTGLLMDDDGRPLGGKLSLDSENRQPWPGEPPAPEPPRFTPDAITREVAELVRTRFGHHPGSVCLDALPATRHDASSLWSWALAECLPCFGPYEDAMSRRSSGLFHTRISSLLNLHRLLPQHMVDDVVDGGFPISSCEGFVRQVIGWREFVHHVHRLTDGFRQLPTGQQPVAETPSDAGWSRWSGSTWPRDTVDDTIDGGACPSELGARNPLPPAFWGRSSGLACLDHVVSDVWREGWSHHITRLMVLCNLATLLDLDPRELTDWFWVAYTDAYDWVVEPNVLAMGTFAVGDLMTTKPYISGAAYINTMSDFCGACQFNPRRNCPITRLYWAFLDRHRTVLGSNPRLRVIMAALRRRSEEQRTTDEKTFQTVATVLANGDEVTGSDLS